MHCPKCGYQQTSFEVKYCSRCGFYLGMVSEILRLDGALPGRDVVLAPPASGKRKKAIRRGAKMLFFSVVTFILALILSAATDAPEFLILPFFMIVASLLWMIYHRLFTEDTETQVQFPRQSQFQPPRPMLRPEEDRMRVAEPRRVNTSDMANPPSVTDHTTQLFDNER
ncbi:MAG TPA: hypothetical protein VE262_23470 [Blastocatellia bacterium]|nr:hypothetical protein [Blastocatellia bacterium]